VQEIDEERIAIQELERAAEAATFVPPAHWKLLDASTIDTWDCQPLRWTVDQLIAQGNFVLIAAETQTGKTLFGLFLALSMLFRGKLFGKLDIEPVNRIEYLGLEDPDRRFQSRLRDIRQTFPELEPDRLVINVAPGFTVTDPRMMEYLEQRISQNAVDVVFLDTYQKATPGISSFRDEDQSLILHRLANLTRKHNVTLIVNDHVRKNDGKRKTLAVDDIKGTGGKAQNADCVILMERTPDRKQVRFQAFSKDSDHPIGYILDVASEGSGRPKFEYAADLDDLGSESRAKGDKNRQRVLDAFAVDAHLSASEAGALVGMTASTVRRHLSALVAAGKLDEGGDGRWRKYWRIAQSEETE
jgi:DNA-binding transcriptional ArsR family regulator